MQQRPAQRPGTERKQHLLANGDRSRGFVMVAQEECDHGLSLSALGLLVLLKRDSDERQADGVVGHRALRAIAAFHEVSTRQLDLLLAELTDAGFVERSEGAVTDRNFSTWHRTRDERDELREAWKGRQSKHRSQGASRRDTSRESQGPPESDSEAAVERSGERTREDEICAAFVVSLEKRGVVRRTVTENWRTEARRLIDRDHRELGEVLEVIAFVTDDPFWAANILSLPKLREKFDQLRLQQDRSNGARAHKPSLADMADQLDRVGDGDGQLALQKRAAR